jgi:hypothetical protein
MASSTRPFPPPPQFTCLQHVCVCCIAVPPLHAVCSELCAILGVLWCDSECSADAWDSPHAATYPQDRICAVVGMPGCPSSVTFFGCQPD